MLGEVADLLGRIKDYSLFGWARMPEKKQWKFRVEGFKIKDVGLRDARLRM